ncbi:MAG: leucine-rich repeat domain-containing protein [Bacteroidales bacterium]|nr:leucine-rich repeat domain-containing protein [Bacteroidales bacterium]
MKKKLSLWMLGIAAMLASCSQNEDLLQGTESNGNNAVTFTVTLDGGMKTRAYTEDPGLNKMQLTGFLVEEPADDTASPVVSAITGITGDGTNGYSVTISDLNEAKSYQLVFWASENGAYNIQDQTVTPADASQPGIAFYGATESYKTPAQLAKDAQLTLTHAVAKVTLNTTTALTDGKIATLSVPTCISFNLISGEATGEGTSTDTSEGATSSDLCSVYVLCNDADDLPTATITLNNGQETEITSLPMKRNNHIKLQGDVNGIGVAEDVNFTVSLQETWNEEQLIFPYTVYETTHTINMGEAGSLTAEAITRAMGTEGKLIVTGPINQKDMQTIVDCGKITLVELDLSGTSGSGVSIPEYAFCTYDETYPKPQIKTLKLGGAVTSVDRYAFRGCNTLTEVQFEDVKTIGQHAFSKCDIKTLKLGAELERIGINAFSENVNLTDVDLSECTNLASIESYAFEKCGISNLKLPENAQLTTLDTGAFQGNHYLLTVTIPATVTRVIVDLFKECNELETIVFQGTTPPKVYSAVGYEGGCFDYCFNSAAATNLTNKSIYIPNVPEDDASIDQWNAFFGSEEWAGIYYGKEPTE